jgi:glycogen(starch) synthase
MVRGEGEAGGGGVGEVPAASAVGAPPQVVMFVYNDARTDARVLREAETLAGAGYRVLVIARPGDPSAVEPETEERNGVTILRVPVPWGWRRWWTWIRAPWRARSHWQRALGAALARGPAGWPRACGLLALAAVALPWTAVRLPTYVLWRLWRRLRRLGPPEPGGDTLDWLLSWRLAVLGWSRRAASSAPPAAVYHAHDLTALPAGREAARRHGGRLIYDSHEIFLEAGTTARRPALLRALFAWLERHWARDADAVVTVNDALAVELGHRLSAQRIVVVHNCPPRPHGPWPPADRLRPALGLAPGTPIALYHGGFSPHRGLEVLAEAILQPGLEGVHAVYLGYGSLRGQLETLAADPRFGGRLHVLDPVSPEAVVEWVAGADVAVMAIQPSTVNHYLSTPNKLFEALAAGVPVVASDFPEIRRIVAGDPAGPLGVLCDPTSPAVVATAIRTILSLPEGERAAWRLRCRQAAEARWNWETEGARLLQLYRSWVEPGPGVRDGDAQ